MNYIYLYDGSFINLINLINYLFKNNIKPDNIKCSDYNPTLFDNIITLEINNSKLVLNNLIKNTNKQIFKTIYYVYLSNDEFKEIIIYYFYLNVFKYQNKIFNMRNLKCVCKTLKISQYVANEIHKYKGFIRFKELDNNCLYALIEPTNNCLPILVNHFKKRLSNEYWIIKDVKRNLIGIYDKKDCFIVSGDNFSLYTKNISKDNNLFEDLWKSFYETISIESRKNERCRQNFMPKKYWNYIIEMSDENEKNS